MFYLLIFILSRSLRSSAYPESYHNTRSLHQKLDAIHERAGEWKSQKLSFNDTEDTFTLRHRDPIAAIESLWKDVHLSQEMVYAGCKIFSDESKTNRIFS